MRLLGSFLFCVITLNSRCDGFASSSHTHAWSAITGKPSTFTPAAHKQAWSTITGKPSTYTPSSHTHSYLPLSGGTLTGDVSIAGCMIKSGWLDWYRNNDIALSIFTNGGDNAPYIYGRTNAPLYLDSSYVGSEIRFAHSSSLCNSGVSTSFGVNNWLGIKQYSDSSAWTYVTASGFNSVSSKRVKENISEISKEDACKILDLTPVNFDYIAKAGGQKNNVGFIAEDVMKILPNMVKLPEEYDAENDSDLENIPSIDYSKFVPYLIKMIQIQQKEIDVMKQK